MRHLVFSLIFLTALFSAASDTSDPFAPLKLYQGAWTMTMTKPPSKTADRLVDDCALIGRYFACQQTINGEPKDLFIIIPRKEPGHYYTQGVNAEGRAYGRAELLIEANRWTFSDKSTDNGKTTFYRTLNVFTGKDRIHFEQLKSADGKHWTLVEAGDEVRSPK
jgi:hypothetical protein